MKVRTRRLQTEGEKIKGKVCRRKERLFNCSVSPVSPLSCGRAQRWMGTGTPGPGQLRSPSGYHLAADPVFSPKSPPIAVVREGK